MAAVAAARAHGAVHDADVRLGVAAIVVLAAALLRGWPSLVPAAVVLAAAGYAAELVVDDARLDASAPVLAAAVVTAAELAYWSIEEREPMPGDSGEASRRVAFVAALGFGALVVGALVLVLVDVVQARGLALDVAGATAAAAVLAVIVVVGRGPASRGR